MITAPDPNQRLREDLAPSLCLGSIVERDDEIKLSILLPPQKIFCEIARHLKNDVGVGLSELAEEFGQQRSRVFVWSAEPYSSRYGRLSKVSESFIVQGEYSLRILRHEHAFGCQDQLMGISVEQLNFRQFFEPPDLYADC